MVDFLTATLKNEQETCVLAEQLAALAHTGDIFALQGDLGAGKSTFARAFIRERMSDAALDVPSPTFTLVQSYEADDGQALLHTDLYRLRSPDDVEDIGLYDEVDSSITLIEWPDRMPNSWWDIALGIELSIVDGQANESRKVRLFGKNDQWISRLKSLGFDMLPSEENTP